MFSQKLGIPNGYSRRAIQHRSIVCILVGVAAVLSLTEWRWGLCVICLLQAPFVAYTRMMNFYPEITLICAVGAISVMLALQKPTTLRITLGYFLAACCWLADARGMVWAIPLTVIMIFQGICDRNWRVHLPAFIVANVFSWKLGSFAFQKYSTPLLRQMDVVHCLTTSLQTTFYEGPWRLSSRFCGQST